MQGAPWSAPPRPQVAALLTVGNEGTPRKGPFGLFRTRGRRPTTTRRAGSATTREDLPDCSEAAVGSSGGRRTYDNAGQPNRPNAGRNSALYHDLVQLLAIEDLQLAQNV